ncbi:MAG: hypothetical protein AAF561_03000 [Planctomycetota bacterium]
MTRLTAIAIAAATAAPAVAQVPSALVSTVPGAASSVIPGRTESFANLDRPVFSPGREFYGFLGENSSGTSIGEDLYAIGNTDGSGLTVVAEELVTTIGGVVVDVLGERNFGIADSGMFGIEALIDTGSFNDDDLLVEAQYVPGVAPTYTVVFEEGVTAIPGIPGGIYDGASGPSYGTGGFGGAFSSIDGVPTSGDTAAVTGNGSTVIVREGETAVTGATAPGAPAGIYTSISFAGHRGDGTNGVGRTRIDPTDGSSTVDVLVCNGEVALYQGQALPGLGGDGVLDGFYSTAAIQPDGGFLQIVDTADGAAGIVDETGTILATTGDGLFAQDVATSSSAADFFSANEDAAGNLLVGGFEVGTEDAIWVYNGQIILREGDQVDITGDGVPDDAFVAVNSLFSASLDNITLDGAFIVDESTAIVGTALNDGAGNEIGLAFISVAIPEPTTASILGLAGLTLLRRRR